MDKYPIERSINDGDFVHLNAILYTLNLLYWINGWEYSNNKNNSLFVLFK